MTLTWLGDANLTTAAKGWSIPLLWLWTPIWFAFWPPDPGLATTWIGGLVLFSGVGAFDQKVHRDTDYEALRIKAGASQPTNVTVQSGQANVSTGGEVKP